MNLTLRVWRQRSNKAKGRFENYTARDISPDMSFVETLDLVNEDLTLKGEDPIAFDSDCREGICGTCCVMINGRAHGSKHGTTVCQLTMREFRDGDTIIVEPLRARAFPIVKDLVIEGVGLHGQVELAGGEGQLAALQVDFGASFQCGWVIRLQGQCPIQQTGRSG